MSADESTPDRWELQQDHISLGSKNIFAPANLRAAAENKAYAELIQHWMSSKYTFRYTGGMVPDIHHILVKVPSLSVVTLEHKNRLCSLYRQYIAWLDS